MKSRTPCTAKTDADLPRYGKKWDFVPNIPAAVANITSKEGSDIQASADASAITEKTGSASLDVPLTDGGVDVVISTNTAAASGGNMGEMGGESLESLDATEDLTAITTEEESIRLENLSPTQCRVCREDFFAFDILRLHLRTHLADTPFRCGLCHFVAEKREELQTHMTSQHQTQLKGFENGTVLATDLTETEKPADRSRVCRNAQIAVRQLLELSPPESGFTDTENTQIESTKVLHKCPACSRTFRGSSYLKQHMKSHTGERPFKCPLCVKTFTSKDTLNKHLGAHSDERHFKCGECGKLFKRISHVREHLKIHSNDRPYCCQICDKTFKTTNALKVHLRTHTDVMPYECRFCERHFREKGSLARHMRMHTGERPYKCNHCGRGFGEHGTLNRHLKAKVPCTKQLILERQLEKSSKEDDVCYPTVLAEFSSVVADTQQYMIPEGGELQEATPEEYGEATEFVVVHTDLGSENVQNVEIITEGEIDPAILDQMTDDGTSYVVVSDSSDNIRVLDPRTGATVAVMPADSDQIQTVAMMPSENEIEAVAMAPLAEEPDTIQQAMLVANVVEEQGEGTLETTEQSTETEHVEATTA